MSEPLVSIVLPTYNRPHYLRLSLETARTQTYRNLEIIVQDNGSDVDPMPVIQALGDPRIRMYRNPTNIGQTPNILAGISKVRGKYWALFCDDDLYMPTFIERLVAPLEADDDCVVSFCWINIIDANGNKLPHMEASVDRYFGSSSIEPGYHKPMERIALVYRTIGSASAAVFRTRAADWTSVPPEITIGADLYLNYLAARTEGSCYYVPERLSQIRYGGDRVTDRLSDPSFSRDHLRTAVFYWNRFATEREFHYRSYYLMQRSWAALRADFYLSKSDGFAAAASQVWRDVCDGTISLMLPFYSLGYLYWLKWAGVKRRFIP
jgi:glycosyltransferase involved in cell wall biosynthesis